MDDRPQRIQAAEAWATEYFNSCDRLSAMRPDTRERRSRVFAVYAGLSADTARFEPIVKEAIRDSELYEIACGIAADLIERNELLPVQLKKFVVGVLAGKIKKPKGKKIRPNAIRDFYLASAVYFVQKEFGLLEARNPASGEHSACDVVARAARNVGVYVNFETLTKLSQKYRHLRSES